MPAETRIILRSGKDLSPRRFHPWIFSGAIKKISGEPVDGDLVEVVSNNDEFLGLGHYQEGGSITVRMVSFDRTEPGKDFWAKKISDAVSFRRRTGRFGKDAGTTAYRLVNAEGDGMPGLIIDYYNGTAVMQFHSIGMHRVRDALLEGLKNCLGDELRAVYDKSETTLPGNYASGYKNSYLLGERSEVTIQENGYSFYVDCEGGQKTGFFLDQRDNRLLLGTFARDRKILNLFGYTGGFSVYGTGGGASEVHTVDSSAPAIEQADRNIRLNYGDDAPHRGFVADAFGFLSGSREQYDLIILDPPAFARHQNVLGNALRGYKRLNAKAIELVRSGGVIFTFSCSQVVSRENFRKTIFAAAAGTGRSVRILHQLSQPADHPLSIYHPEGEYLKGLVLYVE